mmetsp:Transcript_26396/g.83611  ORF Transcript_26396/g.83611 Transcript_26396/m.83611 type:complete len:274 (+) Transcript_26396:203-1024(+)
MLGEEARRISRRGLVQLQADVAHGDPDVHQAAPVGQRAEAQLPGVRRHAWVVEAQGFVRQADATVAGPEDLQVAAGACHEVGAAAAIRVLGPDLEGAEDVPCRCPRQVLGREVRFAEAQPVDGKCPPVHGIAVGPLVRVEEQVAAANFCTPALRPCGRHSEGVLHHDDAETVATRRSRVLQVIPPRVLEGNGDPRGHVKPVWADMVGLVDEPGCLHGVAQGELGDGIRVCRVCHAHCPLVDVHNAPDLKAAIWQCCRPMCPELSNSTEDGPAD